MLFRQMKWRLDLQQSPELTIVIRQIKVTLCAAAYKRMSAAYADVSDAKVIVGASPNAERSQLLLHALEIIVVKVDYMKIFLPGLGLVRHDQRHVVDPGSLGDVGLKDDVVLARLRNLKEKHLLFSVHWVRHVFLVLGFANFAMESFPAVSDHLIIGVEFDDLFSGEPCL